MRKNIGTADRVIRILLAVVAALLILTETVTGTWAVVIGIAGLVILVTGFIGFCGLYVPFKINTRGKKAS